MWVVAQATPVTCLVECAPLQTCAGLYCSSIDKGKLALGGLAAAGGGLPMLMLHVTKAPPDLPAATNNSGGPASSHTAVSLSSFSFYIGPMQAQPHPLAVMWRQQCSTVMQSRLAVVAADSI